jgi:hypothetical protein
MSTSSLLGVGCVDSENRRREVLEDVQNAGTNLVGFVVRRSRTDLADLITCGGNGFIQEM